MFVILSRNKFAPADFASEPTGVNAARHARAGLGFPVVRRVWRLLGDGLLGEVSQNEGWSSSQA